MPTVIAKGPLKVVCVLDPASVANLTLPATPRTTLTVRLPDGGNVTADLACKGIRRAQTTIREAGPEQTACFIQGKLANPTTITEAGIAANVRVKETAE
jgi:hypothetical protein